MAQGRKTTGTAKKHRASDVKPTPPKVFSDLPEGMINISSRFALLNRLIGRDLNGTVYAPTFNKYTKDDMATYLANPYRYEKQLRDAAIYIYGASVHFRRIIQYFVGLTDLAYIIEPYRLDPRKANVKTVNNNYRKVLNVLTAMKLKSQLPNILTVCLREDVIYITMWVTNDDITFQQLPSEYCQITTVEGGVPNVTFDFSYFDSHGSYLDFYPQEFQTKYKQYTNDRTHKWIELDSPTSFAIKCNKDILNYAIPPFAGLFREIYDIEDFKSLKLTKTALANYALIAMKLPMDEEGNWELDYDKAKEFWYNLSAVLPEEVGSVLTPMDLSKISFEKTHTGDTNEVADAEDSLYSASGISRLLFGGRLTSAHALLLSIKNDQSITYGIVKSIEDAINRYVQSLSYGKNWKVNFLDVSPYNREEMGAQYLKAASYGLPTISAYAASQGLGQAELDGMSFLETTVLNLPELFQPIRSSSQMSSSEIENKGATDEGGAPRKGTGELTESGEDKRERE